MLYSAGSDGSIFELQGVAGAEAPTVSGSIVGRSDYLKGAEAILEVPAFPHLSSTLL